MYEIKSRDDKKPVRIPKSRKPRAKDLNDALVSLGGGRMKSSKDNNRSRDKCELRHIMKELKK